MKPLPNDGEETFQFCPKTGRRLGNRPSRTGLKWMFTGAGLLSLVWFLVRVIPKPSRAAYPCQRAAAPLASTFVLWLLSLLISSAAYRRAKELLRHSHWRRALACFGLAGLAALVLVASLPDTPAWANTPLAHGPIGTARGIHPGRVVWVHAPDATDWAGYDSPEHWYEPTHTDLAVVEEMMSRAVRGVAGENTDAAAWAAIFRYFNEQQGKDDLGYQAGEKIMIKINLTTCNARGSQVDRVTYNKNASILNRIDNSPQMLLALLRQLVYTVGVAPADITVGDPTGLFPNYLWNQLHPEFPEVHYLDNYGGSGRTRCEFSTTRFNWSTAAARGKRQDYLPVSYAEADYLINFAVLKGHSSGITVCAKNHYGSLLRCPDGYLRDAGTQPFYNLHLSLPNAEWSPGRGHYRALVDLMGHPRLGGRTLLYLVDGLFGGYYWEGEPRKWKMPPFGDGVNGDWPSSLFASQDPVAIDSVAYDFLLREWPRVVTGGVGLPGSLQGGAEDYLHEAALAAQPPSGTFYDPDQDGTALPSLGVHEHWNNDLDKQYSRNLGLGEGIELLALTASRPAPQLAIHRRGEQAVISWPGSLAGFQLQSAESLSSPVQWTPITGQAALVQGRNTVTNPIVEASQFYRLAK